MRISDWSSDVCSSDLLDALHDPQHVGHAILEMLAFAVIAQPHHRRAIARQLVRRRPSGGSGRRPCRDIEGGRLRQRAELLRVEQEIMIIAHGIRSEEHTSELQSLMRISYAVFC